MRLLFKQYITESTNDIPIIGIKRKLERLVGKLGAFSFTSNKLIKTDSGYYVHFVVLKNPSKAIRIYLNDSRRPTGAYVWVNFGFENGGRTMRQPNDKVRYTTDEQFVRDIVKALRSEVKEGWTDLSSFDRKRWIELRNRVKTAAKRGASVRELHQLYLQAKTLGVAKSTFAEWTKGAKSTPIAKPKVTPTSKPAPAKKDNKDYRSAVSIMRGSGVSDDDIVRRIDQAVETHTNVLKRGQGTSLLITGRGGTGKTTIVRNVLGPENQGKTWETFTGSVSPFSLYQFLFRHRHGKILVFDDTDVFKDDAMVDMLKAALDSHQDRTVGWMSHGRTVTKPEGMSTDDFIKEKDLELRELTTTGEEHKWKPPSSFPFTSKVIFITNKSMESLLKNPHTNALASRALARVDYDFDDELMLKKIRQNWKKIRPDIDENKREQVLKVIEDSVRKGSLANVSMRNFNNALAMLAAGVEINTIKQMMEDGNI